MQWKSLIIPVLKGTEGSEGNKVYWKYLVGIRSLLILSYSLDQCFSKWSAHNIRIRKLIENAQSRAHPRNSES